MAKYYFSLKKNDEVVATYEVHGITKKAAENRLLFKKLHLIKELGEFKYEVITEAEHIAFQHQQVYDKMEVQKNKEYIQLFDESIEKASGSNLARLEKHIDERDLDALIEQLLKSLIKPIKAISLEGLNEATHYRHLQFILTDMHNDVERLKAVIPEREGQVRQLAKIINEIRSLLLVMRENHEDFNCFEVFILFNLFENYYEYID